MSDLTALQTEANRLAAEDPAAAFRFLVAAFEDAYGAFPQYEGWTDDIVLVRFDRTIRARSGYLMWEDGDVAISTRYMASYFGQSGDQTAFATRLGWHVAVGSLYPKLVLDPKTAEVPA